MEQNERELTIEHLKQRLQAYIESNDKVYNWFIKIMRRLFVLIIIAGSSVLISVMVVIYLQKQTEHKNQAALDSINEAYKYMIEQRKFIEYDRKDVATARAQMVAILAQHDSAEIIKDSIINTWYKSTMKTLRP